MDAIVVEGLTRVFRRQTAVDHVSFRVARGRFFGFLGPNGAGKSTDDPHAHRAAAPERG